MILKRILPLVTLAWVSVLVAGCSRDADTPNPLEPEFAKGGKPGAPTDPGTFELLEYYVYRDAGGQSWVHVVGQGDVPFVNLNAVQDFHFNGIRDDDFGDHYEFYHGPPRPVEVAERFEAGVFHVDVPWDGARWVDSGTGEVLDHFRDFPTSDVDGFGADPYSFDVRFQTADASFLDQWQPQGIILGGAETHEPEMGAPSSAYHSFDSDDRIYSYATFLGAEPVGEVHLDEVSVDGTTLTCLNEQSVQRVNGRKVVTWSSVITGHGRIRTASSGLLYPDAAKLWIEWHFVDVSSDPSGTDVSGWRYTWHTGLNQDDADILVEGDFGGRIRNHQKDGMWVSFAVDYVYPNWYPYEQGGFVYDPNLNVNDGFTTIDPVATTVGDHGAIAYTPPVWVTCR